MRFVIARAPDGRYAAIPDGKVPCSYHTAFTYMGHIEGARLAAEAEEKRASKDGYRQRPVVVYGRAIDSWDQESEPT